MIISLRGTKGEGKRKLEIANAICEMLREKYNLDIKPTQFRGEVSLFINSEQESYDV